MHRLFSRAAAAFVVSLAALALFAQTPTIDQLLSMKSVSRPRISPDGRFVAYEESETDWKDNAYVTHLWLADLQSGRSFQLTRGKKSSDSALWSPDGRWLAFMTERESTSIAPPADKGEKTEEKKDEAKPDARQIWLISPSGGEAWALTKHGAKIESFRWSEDGGRIAFAAPVPESKAAKDRKEKYSDYDVFEEDFEQNQLWIADVKAAEAQQAAVEAKQVVRDPKINVMDICWSPDGSKIAFTGTANPLLSFGSTADIYVADLAGDHHATKVVALDGPDRSRPVLARRQRAGLPDLAGAAVLLLREQPHRPRPAGGRAEGAGHEACGRGQPHSRLRRGREPPGLVEAGSLLRRRAEDELRSVPYRPEVGGDHAPDHGRSVLSQSSHLQPRFRGDGLPRSGCHTCLGGLRRSRSEDAGSTGRAEAHRHDRAVRAVQARRRRSSFRGRARTGRTSKASCTSRPATIQQRSTRCWSSSTAARPESRAPSSLRPIAITRSSSSWPKAPWCSSRTTAAAPATARSSGPSTCATSASATCGT